MSMENCVPIDTPSRRWRTSPTPSARRHVAVSRHIYTSPPRRRRDYWLTLYITHRYSTPKVLTMEFIESFKLTDIERVEKEGLDRKDLAKRVADTLVPNRRHGLFSLRPAPGQPGRRHQGQPRLL